MMEPVLAELIDRLRKPREREVALVESALVFEIAKVRAAGRVVRDEYYPDWLSRELRDAVLSDGDLETLIDEVASQADSRLAHALFALGKVADLRGAVKTAETVVAFRSRMDDDQRYQAVVSLQNHDRYLSRLQSDDRILRGITAFLSECRASSWAELSTLAASLSETWDASRTAHHHDGEAE